MATVNLGAIKFNWKGAYSGATAYVVDDVVESGGNSYVCILASTGNTPPNATYWELMASKGTDTSVLTTQGDVLYHDGSSLARLGAGTSGQVLQTGGTGANPSWTTVSSDMVKLAETDITSSVSSVIFDGYFSSTYDRYYITWDNIVFGDNSTNLKIRFNEGGSEYTGADYRNAQNRTYRGISGQGLDNDNYAAWTDGGATIGHYPGNNDQRSASGDITIINPLSTTNGTTAYGKLMYYHQGTGANQLNLTSFTMHLDRANASSGIKFMSDSANYDNGTFKLYGIK
jgi:hypothetical protein